MSESNPIAEARERSPILRSYADRYRRSRPFEGLLVGVSAPLTAHTGLFVDVLVAGGAEVLATGEAGSTDPAVVDWLRGRAGVTPLATAGMEPAALAESRREILAEGPDLIADDGAHLLVPLHEEFPGAEVRGACEQTTGGITRLNALAADGELLLPVYDVNGTPMKRHFDNVHGTAESSLSALTALTDVLLAGSVAVVVGYGYCGRGIARKLRALGARTIVTEVDPRKALGALADGHDVRPLEAAAPEADLLVTATGRDRVVRGEHLDALADGAVIASIGSAIEIDVDALETRARSVDRPEPGVERYRLPDGRRLTLLTGGQVVNLSAPGASGNPSAVMDTTFAMMVRGLAELAAGVDLEAGLHPIPDRIDREVAHEKLAAMDVAIDEAGPNGRGSHGDGADDRDGADDDRTGADDDRTGADGA